MIGLVIYNEIGLTTVTLEFIIVSSIIISLIGAVVELFSPRGTDNLFIPVISIALAIVGYDLLVEISANLVLNVFIVGFAIDFLMS